MIAGHRAGPRPRIIDVDVYRVESRFLQQAAAGEHMIEHWQVAHLIADQSGVGAGLVSWLKSKLGSKPRYRLHLHPRQQSPARLPLPLLHRDRPLQILDTAKTSPSRTAGGSTARPRPAPTTSRPAANSTNTSSGACPATAKISTPYGLADVSTSAQANARALALHDDRLISAALIALCDDLHASGALRPGRPTSR